MKVNKSILITVGVILLMFMSVALTEGHKYRVAQVDAAKYVMEMVTEACDEVDELNTYWMQMSDRERVSSVHSIHSIIVSTEVILEVTDQDTPIVGNFKSTFDKFSDHAFDYPDKDVVVFIDKLSHDFNELEDYIYTNDIIPMSKNKFDQELADLLEKMEIVNKNEPWMSLDD